jgi:hypothetical protein
MNERNVRDFTKLIATLLSQKWLFTKPPTEETLKEWSIRGRIPNAMFKQWHDYEGVYRRKLHIFRGNRDYATIRFEGPLAQVGEWSAWYEDQQIATKESLDIYH